ncbi:MAG: putative metalloprotease CJM1_0395 family protein [Myxococcota bacterium]
MGDEATGGSSASSSSDPGELNDEEQEEVVELKKRDAEVRAHENAHKAAAGQHARGGPTYEYERGPDGRRYAVGGEVRIDTSPVPDDPDATILKMRQVRRAALAPAEPSPQDRRVASEASQQESAARQEKMTQQHEGRAEGGVRRSGAYAETAARLLGGTLDVIA